jgi:hypothetical protein
LPEAEKVEPKVRPKRFTFTPKVAEATVAEAPEKSAEQLVKNDLLDALTEEH